MDSWQLLIILKTMGRSAWVNKIMDKPSHKSSDRIKDWPEDERPRERLIRFGSSTLSDAQLLAIVLRTGHSTQGLSALDLARNLLSSFGSLRNLDSASISEICAIKGIGHAKAAEIKACLEIGKRFVAETNVSNVKFRTSEDVYNFYFPHMKNLKKELFKLLLLDNKHKIIKEITISEGSLTASLVHPREVFNPAIRESAAAVIFVHNHPSGDPAPSQEDKDLTQRLIKASEYIGIRVLDHIIIGDKDYFSFVDHKII